VNKKILASANKALKAILESYDEDSAPAQAQLRVIEYLTQKGN